MDFAGGGPVGKFGGDEIECPQRIGVVSGGGFRVFGGRFLGLRRLAGESRGMTLPARLVALTEALYKRGRRHASQYQQAQAKAANEREITDDKAPSGESVTAEAGVLSDFALCDMPKDDSRNASRAEEERANK